VKSEPQRIHPWWYPPNDRIHHANSILFVLSPPFLPSLTTLPTISSNIPRVKVTPDPPLSSRALSYCPRSMLHPPYGPSIITCTGTPMDWSSWSFSVSRELIIRSFSRCACACSALDQSPTTLEPKVRVREETLDTGLGALRIVNGWDSNSLPPKNTLRRMCWPACQPRSQSWMLI